MRSGGGVGGGGGVGNARMTAMFARSRWLIGPVEPEHSRRNRGALNDRLGYGPMNTLGLCLSGSRATCVAA